jgi:hypothetical protein
LDDISLASAIKNDANSGKNKILRRKVATSSTIQNAKELKNGNLDNYLKNNNETIEEVDSSEEEEKEDPFKVFVHPVQKENTIRLDYRTVDYTRNNTSTEQLHELDRKAAKIEDCIQSIKELSKSLRTNLVIYDYREVHWLCIRFR